MKKMRSEPMFIDRNLKVRFNWIGNVRGILPDKIPGAKEVYHIKFKYPLNKFEYRYDSSRSERTRFEEFVYDFFETKKRRHQVVCCWRENDMTLIVFKVN